MNLLSDKEFEDLTWIISQHSNYFNREIFDLYQKEIKSIRSKLKFKSYDTLYRGMIFPSKQSLENFIQNKLYKSLTPVFTTPDLEMAISFATPGLKSSASGKHGCVIAINDIKEEQIILDFNNQEIQKIIELQPLVLNKIFFSEKEVILSPDIYSYNIYKTI